MPGLGLYLGIGLVSKSSNLSKKITPNLNRNPYEQFAK